MLAVTSERCLHNPVLANHRVVQRQSFPGHRLRAGFATSEARAGVSIFKIRDQTGLGRHAVALRPGSRALSRERRRGSSIDAGSVRLATAASGRPGRRAAGLATDAPKVTGLFN